MALTKRTLFLFGAVLLAVSASCTLESVEPLSDEETSKLDERLIGDWIVADQEEQIWRVARKAGAKKSLELTLIERKADQPTNGPYTVFTTAVDSQRYMSVEDSDQASGAKRYGISRYAWLDDNTLKAFALDRERMAEAITSGRIHGKVTRSKGRIVGSPFEEVLVTDSPEALAGYLAEHGTEVFPDRGQRTVTFKRRKSVEETLPRQKD